MSRGILGVKADPKKQILFSFSARQGEEWPSDDSDSDYAPTKEEAEEHGLKRTQKKKRLKANKKAKQDTDSDHEWTAARRKTPNDLMSQKIPPEILCMIFQHVVCMCGSLPFLCRASRVCRLWKEVAEQASLWNDVDLSFGWIKHKESTLTWLCSNRLSGVRRLNLTSWRKLTSEQLQTVADHCPQLTSINLSDCGRVGFEGIKGLVDKCAKLTSFDLSSMQGNEKFQVAQSKAVSAQSLTYVVEHVADRLTSLNISGNLLVGISPVLNKLAERCPSLEVLEVNNCLVSNDSLVLNIEKLQAGCPKLKIIRMANTRVSSRACSQRDRDNSKGFPNLRELSLATNVDRVCTGGGSDDNFVHRMLKNAGKLRLLDLRGCAHLTSTGLQQLTATHLESLFISQSSVAKYDGIEIVMQKWQHSLLELDLSWNVYPGMSLDLAMRKLSADPSRSKLETLNLTGTSVSCGRIKSLLQGCPNLKKLNLESCRGLPRGMKREYNGEALTKLRADIDSIVQEVEGN